MPELPDITIYVEALTKRCVGRAFEKIRLASPFVVRTFDPKISEAEGKTIVGLRRIGKRIVFELEGGLFLVVHLMIAGRFHWKKKGTKPVGKIGLVAFDLPDATLMLTEASTKKRASIHLVRGEEALEQFRRGGVEPLECSFEDFKLSITIENHTIKRTLTDPTLFSGIGNAYSDEILHRAKMSPVRLTQKMDDGEIERLFRATREVLVEFTDRMRAELGDEFPEKVTAFRPDFAVHGKYKAPCPACGTPVQRIVHAENESNYCPTCQTDGKLLADRALSKLLHGDWPKSLEELEERREKLKPS